MTETDMDTNDPKANTDENLTGTEKTGKRKKKKKHRRRLKFLSILISCAAFCFLRFFAIPLRGSADAMGQALGSTWGNAVGTALGSYRGVSEGLKKGEEDGKIAAIEAKDTTAIVSNKLQEIGNLDVLVAEVKMDTANEVGKDPNSAVFYVFKANAIFSVNLKNAVTQKSDDGHMTITLPSLEVSLTYNEKDSEELASWQKYFWTGESKTGYLAYLNSRREIDSKSLDEIANYDVLMKQAESSAVKQISQLVHSICGEQTDVAISFEDESESNGAN